MLEAEVSDTDSDYSDNGSDNNDLEVDIDDIAPYRQLLESIQNQGKQFKQSICDLMNNYSKQSHY